MIGVIEKHNLGLRKLVPEFKSNGKSISLGAESNVRIGSGGNQYMSWPDMVIDGNGRLHLVYIINDNHNGAFKARLVYQQGDWNGSSYTWSSPNEIVPDTSDSYINVDPAIGITSTGRLIFFYAKEVTATNTVTDHFIYSDDGGTTFSTEQDFINDVQYMADASGFIERGGVLYRPMYGRISGGSGNEYVRFYKSVDNGLTWTFVSNISSGFYSLGESNIIFRNDGLLLCYCRGNVSSLDGDTDNGTGEFVTWSTDLGVNWLSRQLGVSRIYSKMQKAMFPSGTMVCVGRDFTTQYSMYGYSNDGGLTWTYSRIDARNGQNEYAGTVYDPFRGHVVSVYAVETGSLGQSPTSIFCRIINEV